MDAGAWAGAWGFGMIGAGIAGAVAARGDGVHYGGGHLCLVTGASSGIGAALARVYAQQGWDVALTARRGDQLEALAGQLRADYGVEALVFPMDLSMPDAPDALLAAVTAGGRRVDGLVNNAGFGLPGGFLGTDWSQQSGFHQLMTTAPMQLAHRVFGPMCAHGFGRILNVASIAPLFPARSGHALYAAAKAYLIAMSESLQDEARGKGVHVTALCPGLTRSAFHDVNGLRAQVEEMAPSWAWMSAHDVARAGYLACEANVPVRVPGLVNKAMVTLRRVLPDGVARALVPRSGER